MVGGGDRGKVDLMYLRLLSGPGLVPHSGGILEETRGKAEGRWLV